MAAGDALTRIGVPARAALASELITANDTIAFYAAQSLAKQGNRPFQSFSRCPNAHEGTAMGRGRAW